MAGMRAAARKLCEATRKLFEEAMKLDDEERSVLALRMLDSVGAAP